MNSNTTNAYSPHTSLLAAVGSSAPDFRLRRTPDQTLALSSLRGRPVILVLYLADWHPVCTDQLALYQDFLPEFERFNAAVVGISVDSIWSHQAFAHQHRLTFPLLSDFEPKGAVARAYGMYRQPEGTSDRGLFVIDGSGTIRWRYAAPACVNPGVDGILTALEKLSTEMRNREGGNDVLRR